MAAAAKRRLTGRQILGWIGLALYGFVVLVAFVWGGDIFRAGLDPGVPFQTYEAPPAPDYDRPEGWALSEAREPGSGPAAVFFVHPTTYTGGRDWNGPITDDASRRELERVSLPNYAKPFAQAGAVSAPYYRQSSLYTRVSLREDAREARAFAYGDVERAFDVWLARHPNGPIIIAGVEQGGEMALRLLQLRVATDRQLRARLAAAYLIDTAVLAEDLPAGLPACRDAAQTGCILAWSKAQNDDDWQVRRVRRNLVWDLDTGFEDQKDRPLVCVNPVTGGTDQPIATRRQNRGAVDATDLEWSARPGFLPRQVAARCEGGLLRYDQPASDALRPRMNWVGRRKVQPFNLFYGDIEADAKRRADAWQAARAG